MGNLSKRKLAVIYFCSFGTWMVKDHRYLIRLYAYDMG